MNVSVKGMLIASAVAGLVACGGADKTAASPGAAMPSAAGTGAVKCTGMNECKGKGSCGQADHACAGKNECKGKGIMTVPTAEDCTGKGGKVAS